MVERMVESKNMAMDTRRTTSNTYKHNNVYSSNPPQPKILTPKKMDEIREKVL